MPISKAIRQMGDLWEGIIRRIETEVFPAEGLSRGDFVRRYLLPVADRDIDEAMRILRSRGHIWTSTKRGMTRVYWEKPSVVVRQTTAPLDAAISTLMPLVHRYAVAVASSDRGIAADERVNVAARQLQLSGSKLSLSGSALEELRQAFERMIEPTFLDALRYALPLLDRSKITPDAGRQSEKIARRMPSNLDLASKVLWHVSKASDQGISASKLQQRLRPMIKFSVISGVCDDLLASNSIALATAPRVRGRPTNRYVIAATSQA